MKFFRRIGAIIGLSFEASPGLSVLMFVTVAIAVSSMLLVAVSLKLLVDATVRHGGGAALTGGILAAIALTVTIGWLPIGATWSLRLQERIQVALDRRLMTFSAQLPTLDHLDRAEFANKLHLLMNDDRFPLTGSLVTIASVVAYFAMLTIAAVVLGLQRPPLALLPFAIVPLLWLSYRADAGWERVRERIAPDQQLAFDLYGLAVSAEAGKELRVFGLGDEILSRHELADESVARELNRASWRATAVRSLSWLLFAAGYALAVLVTTQRAVQGRATAGDVILVITVALPIVLLAGTAGPYISVLTRLNAAGGRLLWMSRADAPAPGERPLPARLTHGLRVEGLTFAYADRAEPALRDVDLEIPAGSVVALVGDNGAGKSTLVKLLCGLYEPSAGRITVDGTSLRDIKREDWRERICAGFQDFVQFEFLARETIGVGDLPRREQADAVEAAMTRGGSTDVISTLPAGLDTQLGRSWTDGAELSTGQWQKIALSRGLMRDTPLIVVLDEPTAALDPAAEEGLFRRFADAAESTRSNGTVTIIVSHRFSTVRFADVIAVIERGRLTEIGSHRELMSRGGTYAEMFALQSRHYQ